MYNIAILKYSKCYILKMVKWTWFLQNVTWKNCTVKILYPTYWPFGILFNTHKFVTSQIFPVSVVGKQRNNTKTMIIHKWERKYFQVLKYAYPHWQRDKTLAPESHIIQTNMSAQRGHVLRHVTDFFHQRQRGQRWKS